MKVKTCECCGHPIPTYDTLSGLTTLQQRVFSVVLRAGQAGVTRDQIFDRVYADDRDGGPDSLNAINMQRSKMKKSLAVHGLQIVTTRGHGSLWRVEKL